jgi:DNA-directed RNA polymerase specialized sigma24 family protein
VPPALPPSPGDQEPDAPIDVLLQRVTEAGRGLLRVAEGQGKAAALERIVAAKKLAEAAADYEQLALMEARSEGLTYRSMAEALDVPIPTLHLRLSDSKRARRAASERGLERPIE